MNGFIIGRFIPPHSGHTYLIEYALRSCDHLYIMLCAMKDDPIPGPLRYEWMQKLYPTAHIVYVDREDPQASRDNPDAPKLWAAAIKKYIKKPISIVFASEQYGVTLANAIHARYIIVDEGRNMLPVSGKEIRKRPAAFWDFIPELIQYYFVQNIVLALPQAPRMVRRLAIIFDTSYCLANPDDVKMARNHARKFIFIDASSSANLDSGLNFESDFEWDMIVLQNAGKKTVQNAGKKTVQKKTQKTPSKSAQKASHHTLILDDGLDMKESIAAIQKDINKAFLSNSTEIDKRD